MEKYIQPEFEYLRVTRCKDCVYSRKKMGGLVCSYGPCADRIVPSDFFCKYGKRENE